MRRVRQIFLWNEGPKLSIVTAPSCKYDEVMIRDRSRPKVCASLQNLDVAYLCVSKQYTASCRELVRAVSIANGDDVRCISPQTRQRCSTILSVFKSSISESGIMEIILQTSSCISSRICVHESTHLLSVNEFFPLPFSYSYVPCSSINSCPSL